MIAALIKTFLLGFTKKQAKQFVWTLQVHLCIGVFLHCVFHLDVTHKPGVLRWLNRFPLKYYRLTYLKSRSPKLWISGCFIEWKVSFFFFLIFSSVLQNTRAFFSSWCLVFSRWYFTSSDDSVFLVIFLELKPLTLNYTDTVKLQTETNFRSSWLKFYGLVLGYMSDLIT